MILLPVIIVLFLLSAYILYSGIIDKPPFESLQSRGDGWENSNSLSREFTLLMGFILMSATLFLIFVFLD
ncbi:hypothetical protein EGI32_12555 [Ferruginibacter sp. HRS2-29]|nr:hypothetical protein [Ferruginibacter sp. HRS2-29]